jgi:Tfp pilus assembly protein PilW
MIISTPRTNVCLRAFVLEVGTGGPPVRGRADLRTFDERASPAPLVWPSPKTCRRSPRSRCAGFTLTEVLVSATLSVFVLAGVLSAFLMVGRSGYLASSYSELQDQTRRGLDIFGADVRKAANIRWNSAQSITLSVATATNALSLVTYAYDNDAASSTYQCFYRVIGDAASTAPRRALVRNVSSDFAFERFKLEQSGNPDNTATSDLETKQIQVTFRAARTGSTTVASNQSALSARYILRNKRVSN